MCVCNRNWIGNDCSERLCMFGKAHVDTPKVGQILKLFFILKCDLQGDLDMSGDLSTTTVVENSIVYPYGTPEQYPLVEDSDLNELTNTAHYYMECSNAGLCDRSTGECACYNGYVYHRLFPHLNVFLVFIHKHLYLYHFFI